MADQVERIVLELDDAKALVAARRTNAALEKMEKTAGLAVGSMGRVADKVGEVVLKSTQRTQGAIDRLVADAERKASLMGASATRRLTLERDDILKRAGGDPAAIRRITAAYAEMEQKAGGAFAKIREHWMSVAAIAGTVTLAARAVYGFISSQTDAAEAMQNLSDRTGLTLKETELYTAAAKSANVDVNSLVVGVRRLSESLSENSSEGIKGKKALKELSVSALDSNRILKPTGQLIEEIGSAIAKLPDTPAKLRAVTALFGRGGSELLPILKDLPSQLSGLRAIGIGIDDNLTKQLLEADKALDTFWRKWEMFWKTRAASLVGGASGDQRLNNLVWDAKSSSFVPRLSAPAAPGVGFATGLQTGTYGMMRDQRWDAYMRGSGEGAVRLQLSKAEMSVKEAINEKDVEGHRIASAKVELLKEQLKVLEKIESLGKFEYKQANNPLYPRSAPSLVKYGRPGAPALVINQADINAANAGMDEARAGQFQAVMGGMWERQKMVEASADRALAHQIRMVELTAGPDGEAAAVQKIYDLRVKSAKTAEDMQNALYNREEGMYRIAQERFDRLRDGFQGMFEAAFAGGRNLFDSLRRMAYSIFLAPFTQSLSTAMASAMTGRGFSLGGLGLGVAMPGMGGVSWPGAPGGMGGFAGPVTSVGALGSGGGGGISLPSIGGFGGRYGGLLSGALTMGGMGLASAGLSRNNTLMSTAGMGMAGYGIGSMMGMDPIGAGILGAGLGLGISGVRKGSAWQGAAGGAIAGFMVAGPWGAVIGAAIGGIAGWLYKGAEQKCVEKIREVYGLTVDKGFARQIIDMAKSVYGGNLDMAIRAPQGRELIELYAMATGQRFKGTDVLRPTSFSQSGGRLTEMPNYYNGSPVSSNLPYIGMMTGTPNSGMTVQLDPEATREFLNGRMATAIVANPRAVASANLEAGRQNFARRENVAQGIAPMLVMQ